MLTLQELRAVGRAAVNLPHTLRLRGCQSISYVARRMRELICTETSADPATPARADRELMAA